MSASEFNLWLAYRSKYGPLNPVRKYDAGSALIASIINRAHGGKATAKDFMPWGKEPEKEIEVAPSDFIDAVAKLKGARIGR